MGSRLESDRRRREHLETTTYQGISIWGHTPEGQTIIDKLAMFKTGARSLVHREDSVPALAGAGIPDN